MNKIKNSLIVVPFFFTFANAVLGMLAVVKALDSQFIVAAYCILLAAFMDSLDGRLARAFGATSVIGMELDSLCDAISFCLAPVVLLYCWEAQDFGTVGFLVLAIYLCAGLFRLAKFNITCTTKQSNCFLGLPTPIAAFFVTSLVLYGEWLEAKLPEALMHKNVIFTLIIFISFLMVSRIPFPSFKKRKFKEVSFILLILAIFGTLCFVKGYPIMLIVPIGYILLGFTGNFYKFAKNQLSSRLS